MHYLMLPLLLLLALPTAVAAGSVQLRNDIGHCEGDESKDE
jgi:hypothetical protein